MSIVQVPMDLRVAMFRYKMYRGFGYSKGDDPICSLSERFEFHQTGRAQICKMWRWCPQSPRECVSHFVSCKVLQNARLSECDVRVHSEALVQNLGP